MHDVAVPGSCECLIICIFFSLYQKNDKRVEYYFNQMDTMELNDCEHCKHCKHCKESKEAKEPDSRITFREYMLYLTKLYDFY